MSKRKSSNSTPTALKISDTFVEAVRIMNAGGAADPDEYFSAVQEVTAGVDDLMRQAGVRATEFNRAMWFALATSKDGLAFLTDRESPRYQNPTQDAIDGAISYLDPDLDLQ